MPNLNVLETFRTKEELVNYFKEMGQNITEKEIEELKKSYEQTEKNKNTLSLKELDSIAGGITYRLSVVSSFSVFGFVEPKKGQAFPSRLVKVVDEHSAGVNVEYVGKTGETHILGLSLEDMQNIQAWNYTGSDDCLSGIKGKLEEMSRLKPEIFEHATEGIERVYKTSPSNLYMSEEFLQDKPLLEARALAQTFSDLYHLDDFNYPVYAIKQDGTSLTIPMTHPFLPFVIKACSVQFNKEMTTDNQDYTGEGTYDDYLRSYEAIISLSH